MNKIIKGILLFAAGVGVGGYAGYLFGIKKCDQIVEEEAEQWRALVNEKQEKLKKQKEQIIKDAEGIDELSASAEAVVGRKYNRLVNSYVSDMGKNPEDIENIDRYSGLSNRTPNGRPYVITYEQFNEENDHYDKSTISFYEDDETLADENEAIIDDVEGIVGLDSLNQFGNGSEDPEIVYVRNDRMHVDYEIIRLSKSYAETVGGFTR